MTAHATWRQLRQRLIAGQAVKDFASCCTLVRIEGDSFLFETNQAFTKGQANKLVQAINRTIGAPVAIVIRRLPCGLSQRFYSDNQRKSA